MRGGRVLCQRSSRSKDKTQTSVVSSLLRRKSFLFSGSCLEGIGPTRVQVGTRLADPVPPQYETNRSSPPCRLGQV